MKKRLLLGVLILGIMLSACSAIPGAAAGEVTFSDDKGTIEMTAPSDYSSYETDGYYLLSIGNDYDSKYVDITVEYKEDLAYEYTLAEYTDDSLYFWEMEYGAEILESEEITINGKDCIVVGNTYSMDGYNFESLSYFVETDDAFYVVDAYTLASSFDDFEEEFVVIVESFDEK